ncbi:hypothetical protein ACMZOO_07110 [Catenovulum sp. SX2]|uniref:hypothetical protein n=1 Tax=Catenovulum sp. SX2 TaxID=3398614 RepID=UPI003F86137D
MNVLKKLALASTLVGFSAIASAADTWVGSIDVLGSTQSAASGCSWGNWNYVPYTGVTTKVKHLSCQGETYATAVDVLHQRGRSCYVQSADSSKYIVDTTGSCSADVYKKAPEIPVYPGDQCSWVQKQGYYGYDYYDFKCFYHGVVATKTVGYPWSYSSPGYSCQISGKTGFNVTTTGTGLGDTQCDITKITK